MQLDLCPKTLASPLFSRDLKSTAESFKLWDTCMDNKTCKIVAIVGICLAVLFFFWIVMAVARCICMGFSCLEALCCCCCRRPSLNRYVEPAQDPYQNPNMYPRQQPMMQAQPVYQPVNSYQPSSYQQTGYTGRKYSEDEDVYSHDRPGYKPTHF